MSNSVRKPVWDNLNSTSLFLFKFDQPRSKLADFRRNFLDCYKASSVLIDNQNSATENNKFSNQKTTLNFFVLKSLYLKPPCIIFEKLIGVYFDSSILDFEKYQGISVCSANLRNFFQTSFKRNFRKISRRSFWKKNISKSMEMVWETSKLHVSFKLSVNLFKNVFLSVFIFSRFSEKLSFLQFNNMNDSHLPRKPFYELNLWKLTWFAWFEFQN